MMRMKSATQKIISQKQMHWQLLAENPLFKYPEKFFWQKRQLLDEFQNNMINSFRAALLCRKEKLGILSGRLSALSPLATLARGYCICQKANGDTVKYIKQIEREEQVRLIFQDGKADCRVEALLQEEVKNA